MRTCATCGGRGQVLMSRGIFSIAQTCPHCKGAGRILEKPCKSCHGEGKRERTSKIKLRIPPGVDAGSRLRSSGNGEAGFRGGPPGDLYVVLHVKAHEIFQRDGDDLLCEVPVSFVQAALGAEIEVPTLEGRATIKIPAGTQPGTMFRVKGKGVKNLQGYGHGDLHVRVQVEVPTRLNGEQKAKLQEFAALVRRRGSPWQRVFLKRPKNCSGERILDLRFTMTRFVAASLVNRKFTHAPLLFAARTMRRRRSGSTGARRTTRCTSCA